MSGWVAIGLPEFGLSAWVVAAIAWGTGCAALTFLAISVRARSHETRSSTVHRSPRSGRRHPLRAIAAIVLVSAGAAGVVTTVAATGLDHRESSPLAEIAQDRAAADIAVEIVGAGRAAPAPPWASDVGGGQAESRQVIVPARAIELNGARLSAAIPVAVTLPASDGVVLGATMHARARLAPAAASDRAAFRARVTEPAEFGAPPAWAAWSAPLRTGLATAATALGGDGGALVPGLAIGDTAAVSEDLDTAMKASSLSHLTAVSGANCAIVTAAVFALAALLGAPRWARVLVAAVALAGFVVLVTPESSVVRAAVMALVVLAALAAGRPGGGVPALAVAVIVLLAVDPWYARDFGFALSVCATAGLLVGAGPLAGLLARGMPRWLAVALAVPLAAQLACQPVLVLLDPAVSLAGVPANLLAAAAAPIATIAGVIGCLLLPVSFPLGWACLQVAWVPATWIAAVAHGAAGLAWQRVPWVPDVAGAALLAAITALALWLVFSPPTAVRRRRAAMIVLIVAIAVPIGSVVVAPTLARTGLPHRWDIAMCDIGQGDAAVIRVDEAVALVDAGREPAPLTACLHELGIDRIDLLVLTHWDADHVGGASAVVGRVDTVLHGPLDDAKSQRVIAPFERSGADLVQVTRGVRGDLGTARWNVLWPPARTAPGNDGSVVLDLRATGYRAVFLGDLGEASQDRMLATGKIGAADIVKVAHHGSADQSERLYDKLDATVGLIGVGADNEYGHPTRRLLDLLDEAGTRPFRTDRSGLVVLDVDDAGAIHVWTARGASDVGGPP